MASGELDEGFGGIAACDGRGFGVAADYVRERSRATPNIQPVNAGRNSQPGYELSRELSAPSTHEIFVD
jgi:hypothetical protein